MVVIIDNYDSFTYNLVQYIAEIGVQIQVFRNDQVEVDAVRRLAPDHIVISPGPGNPNDAGVSMRLIAELGAAIPVLGVCLGHQCIGQLFGGMIKKAVQPMHGKTALVYHHEVGIFQNIPNPVLVTRYHSLIVAEPLPPELEVVARTETGVVMGLRHRTWPMYGVQFHPEAILTQCGKQLLQNFLAL